MNTNPIRRFLHFKLGLKFIKPDAVGKGILRAANLLKEKGWIKYYYRTEEGMCSGEALRQAFTEVNRVSSIVTFDSEALKLARKKVAKVTGKDDIEIWNDNWVLKKEEVIATLNKAAWI